MDTRQMLLDTAEKMFADHCDKALLDQAEQGQFPDSLLGLIREGGFQQLAMSSSGVDLADALAVLRVAGLYALPLPLAEMLLANRWLGNDERLVSIGSGDTSGADNVPWGRAMDAVIALSPNGEAHLLTDLSVDEGVNLAGEPRDGVRAGAAQRLSIEEDADSLLALTRAVLMAGGLERALALSLDYVSEREQFGRPISKFQAIQHHMAVMAAETAASIISETNSESSWTDSLSSLIQLCVSMRTHRFTCLVTSSDTRVPTAKLMSSISIGERVNKITAVSPKI